MDKNDRMTKWEFIRPKEYGSELGHNEITYVIDNY